MRAKRQALIEGVWTDRSLSDRLLSMTWQKSPIPPWALWLSGGGTALCFAAIAYTMLTGIGTWGNNIPNAWGFGIINFVWWIGIGHAGTFISAVLLLLEQPWRNSINRIAESMTLFAIVQAGLYPMLHLGRPWFFYWLVPYPSTMEVWPQFMSTLPWDVVAISTYGLVSLMFWYLGLIPDLAAIRDRAPTLRRRRVYGVFALGWRGSTHDWRHYRKAQLLLAGLATPLVLSVHSIVSMDFAIAKLTGWHSTLFPPYFVAGAIFSGFAMVVTVTIPVRRAFGLHALITQRHLDLCGKMLLVTGMLVAYSYLCEWFIAWYSGVAYERFMYLQMRPFGPYALTFWLMILGNVLAPQILWSGRVRRSPSALFGVSLVIQMGMWLERFVLIVTSQSEDFLPASWGLFMPSFTDAALFLGTLSFFGFLFLLLLRFVPFVPVSEMKELHHELQEARGGGRV